MRVLSFLVLLVTGLALAGPGLYLMTLGGSWYYAVAGILVLLCAWLVLRRDRAGILLLWLVLLGTAIWSVWEVGMDGWALMPRLVYLAMLTLAVWLLSLGGGARRTSFAGPLKIMLLLCGLGAAGAAGWAIFNQPATPAPPALAAMQLPGDSGDWTHYGRSLAGTRYSRLAQITPANAANLEQAWVFHTGTRPRGNLSADLLQVTPLMWTACSMAAPARVKSSPSIR